jgi:hypothetical protein
MLADGDRLFILIVPVLVDPSVPRPSERTDAMRDLKMSGYPSAFLSAKQASHHT